MAVELNHTIVACRDAVASSRFFADILGLGPPFEFGPFWCVDTANGVSLDFMVSTGAEIAPQHYAFLITEEEFDAVFARIQAAGLDYWADPHQTRPGEINTNDGGRGVYFPDANGHLLEVLTRPYGSGE